MNSTTMKHALTGLATALAATAAMAQTTAPAVPQAEPTPAPAPSPTPSPTPTPTPEPTLAPTPAPGPTPAPTPTPTSSPTTRPTPLATRTPAPAPTPRATPTPTPTPASTPTPAPSPSREPTPARAAPPPASPSPGARDDLPIEPAPLGEGGGTAPAPPSSTGAEWWAGALAALLALAGVGTVAWLLVRRRRGGVPRLAAPAQSQMSELPATQTPATQTPATGTQTPEPAPSPAPPPVAALPAARLTIGFRPQRAGLNLLSATVEGEITLINMGEAPATDIRADARLLSAHSGQEADLRAVREAPGGRPAAPPFTLAPGEERRVAVVTSLPRDAIRAMPAGAREMFVPLVAINVRYASNDEDRLATRVFAVGVERVDSAKLAPFWLDALPRMYEQVAARAQTGVTE